MQTNPIFISLQHWLISLSIVESTVFRVQYIHLADNSYQRPQMKQFNTKQIQMNSFSSDTL